MNAKTAPLAGYRIIDLTRVYSGPYCTFMLAQAGAEVIKIEEPGGESLRRRNAQGGSGFPFAMLNANKKSVVLDLKDPPSLEQLKSLLRTADVVVENFRPGVMDRLGLSDDALRALNPKLIRASISGYGSAGPYRDHPAMDLTIQAVSGVMETTGYADAPPMKAGPAMADFSAGTHLYGAILTALLHRERTGEALSTEVAMLDAVYPTLCSNLGLAMGGDDHPPRTGNRHGGLSLCPYNVYPASDGFVAILCNSNAQWLKLLGVIGRAHDLGADPRLLEMPGRVQLMDYVDAEIGRETSKRTRAELFAALNAAGAPCGSVRTLKEVMADPHLRERGMIFDIDHPVYGPMTLNRSPLRFAGAGTVDYDPSHTLGADNAEVLGKA